MTGTTEAIQVFLVGGDPRAVERVEQVLNTRQIDTELCTASDGEEALMFLQRSLGSDGDAVPDLIVLDWEAPGGVQSVLKQIRWYPHLRGVPVLIYSDASAKLPEAKARANEHTTTNEELYEALRSLLEGVWRSRARTDALPHPEWDLLRLDETAPDRDTDGDQDSGSEAESEPSEPTADGALADLIARVRRSARGVCRSLPEQVRADAESAAMIGLMEALRHFKQMDPQHFEGYLTLRVRGAIRDEARRFDPLSRRTRDWVQKVQRAVERHRRAHGTEPEVRQIAEAVGLDEDKCWEVMELSHYRSLPIDDESLASPPRTAEDFFVETYAAAALRWALRQLPKRRRLVLRLWYKRGLAIATIARRLGVSTARAHQIRVEAERQLGKLIEHSPPIAEMGHVTVPTDWNFHTDEARRKAEGEATTAQSGTPPRIGADGASSSGSEKTRG